MAENVIGNPQNGHIWWLTPSRPEELADDWGVVKNSLPDSVWAVMGGEVSAKPS